MDDSGAKTTRDTASSGGCATSNCVAILMTRQLVHENTGVETRTWGHNVMYGGCVEVKTSRVEAAGHEILSMLIFTWLSLTLQPLRVTGGGAANCWDPCSLLLPVEPLQPVAGQFKCSRAIDHGPSSTALDFLCYQPTYDIQSPERNI